MRFSIADMLIVVEVLGGFLAANSIQREGHFIMRKGNRVVIDIPYTYYGYPLKACEVGENRAHWQPLGILANTVLAVAVSAAAVFAFRFVRRKFFRGKLPDESPPPGDSAEDV